MTLFATGPTLPLDRLLIANRGEIAVRVIRACRDEGIAPIVAYADSDRDALFVRLADEAYALGGERPAETYLDAAKLIAIALRAMEAPLREIVTNCGEEPSVVLNTVADGKDNFGYNAATGEFGDMIAMGILDPTKVTRSALQNAASIAGLMITTEAMVAELPKKEAPAHDHGGGGMGGMGGMDF